ncbi:hypothetical protein C8J55DRAFT_234811 [Lentinula edodes]|uniref:Uncharacterized protein n=1 Tax=Lentinula lateritia TaxID=40482 RepID=A0A9W8ZTY8_9AGAR|nr:hypothetical protein C8J55DRAFT_234811 [Lentinula edodes]
MKNRNDIVISGSTIHLKHKYILYKMISLHLSICGGDMVILSELQLLSYCPSPLHIYHSLFPFLHFSDTLRTSLLLLHYSFRFFCVLCCERFQSIWSSKLQILNGNEFHLILETRSMCIC